MKFKAKVFYNHQKCRALAIPADKTLDDLSDETRIWIGPTVTEDSKEFDTSEQLIGFNPPVVWEDFQTKGWSGFEVKVEVGPISG